MSNQDIAQLVRGLAESARTASFQLATASTEDKNRALERVAALLVESGADILRANERDLAEGRENGLSDALLDRLKIDDKRLEGIAAGVREVVALPDPVGEVIEAFTRPNGIRIERRRVPMGVVGIIYESRPNVTIDCAVLCLKSGNASLLRGGKEAFHTNGALANVLARALKETGFPEGSVQLIPTTDREALNAMLKLDGLIQCIIPRGGEGLIRFVTENSHVPVIKHYKGVCNLYLDRAADPAMAEAIAVNAKCQRPGVCNAIENLCVDREVAAKLLPPVARALREKGVELRVDREAGDILRETAPDLPTTPAKDSDWTEEYLDLILAVTVVDGVDGAVEWINRHGSGHSDAIVTTDETAAQTFLSGVDAAAVYWNASTRFTDGYEFGLGAEIGISTDKLHARGPMGLRELCSYKYVITGTGQIRG